jgi:sugar phosphate isomerase/epimerase
MRIGTTLIPLVGWWLDSQEPEAGRSRHLEAIRILVENHRIEAIELNGDFAMLYPQVIDEGYYELVAGLQEELGFACTLHLPFLWLDGASLNEPARQATMLSLEQVVQATSSLLVESYVFHLWGMWTSLLTGIQDLPPEEKQGFLNEILLRAEHTLVGLGGLLAPETICVENLERFPFEGVVPMIQRLGMRICFDVGHLVKTGGDAPAFLAQYWKLIGEIHLHDAVPGGEGEGRGRDHLPLGNGEVDYEAFMETLERCGYDKVLIIEVNTENDLLQSLERVRPWL